MHKCTGSFPHDVIQHHACVLILFIYVLIIYVSCIYNRYCLQINLFWGRHTTTLSSAKTTLEAADKHLGLVSHAMNVINNMRKITSFFKVSRGAEKIQRNSTMQWWPLSSATATIYCHITGPPLKNCHHMHRWVLPIAIVTNESTFMLWFAGPGRLGLLHNWTHLCCNFRRRFFVSLAFRPPLSGIWSLKINRIVRPKPVF
jgi:hypothetical protein